MKKQVEIIILLLFGLAFLVYLFPFVFVEAAKFQSGVIVSPAYPPDPREVCPEEYPSLLASCIERNTPPTTEKICDDMMDNDYDRKIDAADEDCAPTSSQPVAEICANGQDDNSDGIIDEPECTPQGNPTAGTCGLQIVSGVPINYGQINPEQVSAQQIVSVKNEGTSPNPAKIMIKGGDWISDAAGNPIIFPTMITHVAIAPNLDYDDKKALSSNGWELGQIAGGQSIPVYFQMKPAGAIDASLNSFTGSLHQDVTIDLIC